MIAFVQGFLSKLVFLLRYRNPHIFRSKVMGRVYFFGRGKFLLGKNVIIDGSFFSNPVFGGGRCTLVIRNNAIIEIGDNSGLSNCVIVSSKKVRIGNDVLIGAGVKIYDTDFHQISYEKRKLYGDTDIKSKTVEIDNGVFIGAGSIILKGSHIGKGAVIGAGSVVSGNIPDNQVWAGNPARFIKNV